MTHKWTFETAAEFWRQHHTRDTETVWDTFTAAEAFILDHTPKTRAETEQILDVLIDQGPDGRGDGRDHKALRRVRTYLRGLRQTAAIAA